MKTKVLTRDSISVPHVGEITLWDTSNSGLLRKDTHGMWTTKDEVDGDEVAYRSYPVELFKKQFGFIPRKGTINLLEIHTGFKVKKLPYQRRRK